jgi:hypothetical protein
MTSVETFRSPWPEVLLEMKDYLDLFFLALGKKRQTATVTIFISKTLVTRFQLQPYVQDFRASIARIPDCRIEFKGTQEPAHKIEIEYRR